MGVFVRLAASLLADHAYYLAYAAPPSNLNFMPLGWGV